MVAIGVKLWSSATMIDDTEKVVLRRNYKMINSISPNLLFHAEKPKMKGGKKKNQITIQKKKRGSELTPPYSSPSVPSNPLHCKTHYPVRSQSPNTSSVLPPFFPLPLLPLPLSLPLPFFPHQPSHPPPASSPSQSPPQAPGQAVSTMHCGFGDY